jgi:hypothetical protein
MVSLIDVGIYYLADRSVVVDDRPAGAAVGFSPGVGLGKSKSDNISQIYYQHDNTYIKVNLSITI